MASTIICLAINQKFNFSRYILLCLVKNIEAGVPFYMFPRIITPLFENMLVPATEEVGQAQDDVSIPTEPSTSKPHKKHKSKQQQPIAPKAYNFENGSKWGLYVRTPRKQPRGSFFLISWLHFWSCGFS
nr:hypothetical protein [Tanacetum cinerariifolium]